jgi:hypothetical protein
LPLAIQPEAGYVLRRTNVVTRHEVTGPAPCTDSEGMNRFERRPQAAGEAEVRYGDGEYRVIRPGGFVRCATTNVPIPLDELRYWSVDLQEAYSGPDAILLRLGVTGRE